MILPLWRTMGEGSLTSAPVAGAQWAYGLSGRGKRTYRPRVRGDVAVLPGDLRSADPAQDTWEGEAT